MQRLDCAVPKALQALVQRRGVRGLLEPDDRVPGAALRGEERRQVCDAHLVFRLGQVPSVFAILSNNTWEQVESGKTSGFAKT